MTTAKKRPAGFASGGPVEPTTDETFDPGVGDITIPAVEEGPATRDETEQFVADMEAAGLRVEAYAGRWFWFGPAVRVDDISDAMSKTTVACQYDQMGLGYIVYPKTGDITWYAKNGGRR